MQGRGLGEGEWPSFNGLDAPPVTGKVDFSYAGALRLSSMFSNDSEVLLWVTQTRVWHTNLHLYYRFRESYGDRRLVEDAPGHLLLHYEKADLLSSIQICLQCGWDFWVLGAEGYARLFVSHDEFFEASFSSA